MNEPFYFSPPERELIVELLQHEYDELPVEIHHSRVAAYRDALRSRQAVVHELLERMRIAVEV